MDIAVQATGVTRIHQSTTRLTEWTRSESWNKKVATCNCSEVLTADH